MSRHEWLWGWDGWLAGRRLFLTPIPASGRPGSKRFGGLGYWLLLTLFKVHGYFKHSDSSDAPSAVRSNVRGLHTNNAHDVCASFSLELNCTVGLYLGRVAIIE